VVLVGRLDALPLPSPISRRPAFTTRHLIVMTFTASSPNSSSVVLGFGSAIARFSLEASTVRRGRKLLTALALACGVACTPIGVRPAVSQPCSLSVGVTLAIDDQNDSSRAADSGITPVRLTIANQSGKPIKVMYCDFSLSGRTGQRYMALLPAELGPKGASGHLLPEGVLESGHTTSGFLYFRLPLPRTRPIDLRVDLKAANDTPISRSFLALRLN